MHYYNECSSNSMLIKFDLLNLKLPNCLLCHVSRKHNYLVV